MKTIGLIGGMSWESTQLYYQFINRKVKQQLGGLNSAKVMINSVNFAEIAEYQQQNRWQDAGEALAENARQLQCADADMVLICANTMHKVYDQVQSAVDIPVLHMADCVAKAILQKNLNTVALLGTKYTMQLPFYRERLAMHGIQAMTPDEATQDQLHQIIYQELCLGIVNAESAKKFQSMIEDLTSQGAQGIILGCTELVLFIEQLALSTAIFDSAQIHAEAAVDLALGNANFSDFSFPKTPTTTT
ncbi:aspartate racemase [Acinetobacter marinus]|uniref:Aspartate racemase n=1 Tax=Acinetobacter marinus TaxID=281375 RepID=A0A1G6HEJ4_9GAMM|nr:aspartate/glutamate racemase family protein [Acinetobacter marinus]SDB92528.1 aspartate racemase [Acinetobacter marinus]